MTAGAQQDEGNGRAGEAAAAVQDKAQQAAGQAQEKVQEAAGQAQQQVAEAAGQARDRVREQLDQRTTQAGERIQSDLDDARTVAEELRKQGKDAPARYVEQAAERGERVAGYLRDADPDRMLRDIEDFGRRRPWALAAGGLVLGLAASRFLKASSAQRYRASLETPPRPSEGVTASSELPAADAGQPDPPRTLVGASVGIASADRPSATPPPPAAGLHGPAIGTDPTGAGGASTAR